jgi:hypothetical protein
LTNTDLDILADKLAERLLFQPRWLKIKQAAAYSGIGQKRLKVLAENGEIIGYSDPDSGRGDWIFDRNSLDDYRMKPIQETNTRFQKILDGIGG